MNKTKEEELESILNKESAVKLGRNSKVIMFTLPFKGNDLQFKFSEN